MVPPLVRTITADATPGDGHSPQIATGISAGTTTSSAVMTQETNLDHEIFYATAYHDGFFGRNNAADPSLTTGAGTFYVFHPITPNGTIARWRVLQSRTISSASAVTTLSRAYSWASGITAITFRWFAVGR